MGQTFAELILRHEQAGWYIMEYSEQFLDMTGFTAEELQKSYQGHFMSLLSQEEGTKAEAFLKEEGNKGQICPWIFTIPSSGRESGIKVLLQKSSLSNQTADNCIMVHPASFGADQNETSCSLAKNWEAGLKNYAQQDTLTGLYNRYTSEIYIDGLLKSGLHTGMSVLFVIKLNGFKNLNETLGHLCGDEMLRQTAACLRVIFDKHEVLGRTGSAEFTVFWPDCLSKEEASEKAEKVCACIGALDGASGIVSVSAGIAVCHDGGRLFSQLYRCAGKAADFACGSGQSNYAYYDESKADAVFEENLPVSGDWLLEESSDIIYVSDFYNYNLLYMNKGARDAFEVHDNSYMGRKCYEVLQHMEHPCDFCSNHLLSREEFYTWKFRNKKLGKSYLLHDRIVDWHGVPARIEFASDISQVDKRNQDLEDQIKIDEVIISCLRELNSARTLEDAGREILKKLAELYNADRAFILNYVASDNRLMPRCSWSKEGTKSAEELLGTRGIKPDGKLQECFQTRENYLFDRAEGVNQKSPNYIDILYDAGIYCQRGAPFYVEGRPAGMIGVDNPGAFREDMTILETLGYFISEELTRNSLAESLSFLSYHDSLTQLFNRNRYVMYMEELNQTPPSTLGVAVADINSLKEINKLKGHAQGDAAVREAANILVGCFPQGKIFRLSGDEFVVHCENMDYLKFRKQVKEAKDSSLTSGGYGISIGYAWAEKNIDCSKLTRQAADIMLMQKQEYYEQRQAGVMPGKHNYKHLQELLEHLKKGYFKMYLQPKADCRGFELNGAEALARYESPDSGLIPPARFINIMEQQHLIQYLDIFIFEEVCKLLARWKAEGRRIIPVSLNFSRQTVLEPDLLERLQNMTERYDVPKDYIEIEITETLGDYEKATIAEFGAGIKTAGFRLALDDFGSHYTNMAMLSDVPADVLKLDRSLVTDVLYGRPNQLVMKSILSLCRELGISSVAEGVETQEQFEMLRSLSCDSIQGYLFGRPVSVEEFERLY